MAMTTASAPSFLDRRILGFVRDERFSVIHANTPDLIDAAFRHRGLTFGEECGFEKVRDGKEFDDNDAHSLHAMVYFEGVPVAVVRLIKGREVVKLPFFSHCVSEPHFPRAWAGEISRLSCSRTVKQQLGLVQHRSEFQILVHLLKAILEMSVTARVKYWCMLLEQRLLVFLEKMGGYFISSGVPVEWPLESGVLRKPYWTEIRSFSARMHDERPELWSFLTNDGLLIEEIPQ